MLTVMKVLARMSLDGTVIILMVLLLRMLFRAMHISYKFSTFLWLIAFFYLVFPWKIAVHQGFWNYETVEETTAEDKHSENLTDGTDYDYSTYLYVPDEGGEVVSATELDNPESKIYTPEESELNPETVEDTENFNLRSTVEYFIFTVWAVGIALLGIKLILSYAKTKKMLSECICGEEGVRYVEGIKTPMVFGFISPKIYMQLHMCDDLYPYVLMHEKMHIVRRDYIWKLMTYVVCMIHWINPFVWLAYYLFGCDIEKACDEAVVVVIGEEKRKEYASALLLMNMSENRKKTIFVAPVCFDEGSVRGRINNILKYKKPFRFFMELACVICVAFAVLLVTKSTPETDIDSHAAGDGNSVADIENNIETEGDEELTKYRNLPQFFTRDSEALKLEHEFNIENYYITDRIVCDNRYYIDGDGVLWGSGTNQNGQLGIGSFDDGQYDKPVKIAENVVSVDADWNSYFCIYLTDGGELYGMGLNIYGLLLGKDTVKQVYSENDFDKVVTPKLLMKDVKYARAGRESIVALKDNGDVYFWGQYATTTSTQISMGPGYWSIEEGNNNPVKMLTIEPTKILEDCIYVTNGAFNGAAINSKGELYTWGLNVFGQCGTARTEDDFVRTPVKVLDNVSMVWVNELKFNDYEQEEYEFDYGTFNYAYNIFVLLKDGKLMAAGENLGEETVVTALTGDLMESVTHKYASAFVPIKAVQYSKEYNLSVLNQLEWGMTQREVQSIFTKNGLRCKEAFNDTEVYLYVEDSRYYCYFDEGGGLSRIYIQYGSSRDERFDIDMDIELLQDKIENAGGKLELLPKNEDSLPEVDIYEYTDTENETVYAFGVYKGKIANISEYSAIPSYYAPIVENVREHRDDISYTFYSSNEKWMDTGISPAGGHYNREISAWYMSLDGKTYTFADTSLEDPSNYEGEMVGVFAIPGTNRICAVFSDFAPILNLNSDVVTYNPELVFIDFDKTSPTDYLLTAFYSDDLDASYAWVDSCYLLGNKIYIASRDNLCSYDIDRKYLSECTDEYQAANDLVETLSDDFPAPYCLCNFLAIYTENDIVVYQGDIADGFDAPASALIYVAFQNGQCISDMYIDLRSDSKPVINIR